MGSLMLLCVVESIGGELDELFVLFGLEHRLHLEDVLQGRVLQFALRLVDFRDCGARAHGLCAVFADRLREFLVGDAQEFKIVPLLLVEACLDRRQILFLLSSQLKLGVNPAMSLDMLGRHAAAEVMAGKPARQRGHRGDREKEEKSRREALHRLAWSRVDGSDGETGLKT